MKTDPKKKSIPKVLRPTIALPENAWGEVWECVYDRARQTLDRLAKHYPPTTAEMVGMLEYTKKQLEEYCLKNGIEYGVDETNYDLSYSRNKLRANIVNNMSEKELLVELILELKKIDRKCDDIARKIVIWSN